MKRLVVTAPGKDVASCTIEIEEVPVPKPGSGEVLIKVAAAAINPSDYMAWYGCKAEECPFGMGTEVPVLSARREKVLRLVSRLLLVKLAPRWALLV
jgi:NADPH-dependent curcumin reductase CurA